MSLQVGADVWMGREIRVESTMIRQKLGIVNQTGIMAELTRNLRDGYLGNIHRNFDPATGRPVSQSRLIPPSRTVKRHSATHHS